MIKIKTWFKFFKWNFFVLGKIQCMLLLNSSFDGGLFQLLF
jgi:hypothetical protein